MSKKTVEDLSLTNIADAIRAKGNTDADLVFPSGFIEAINNLSGDIPEGYIKPIGNLTDSLINRETSGAYHEATIPAGYYVNEDIVIHEWNSGQLTGNNTAGSTYVVPYSTIGFTPKYCALIANSDKAKNANMVLAVFGNATGGRSIYTGSKASLSTTYTINTGGHAPTCNSNGITFPSISSTKYGNFNYRWFALR